MGRAPHLGLFSSPSQKDILIAEESLSQIGIEHLKNKPFTQISGGERQLVIIARALTQEPEVLLMDEPTSHLDFKNQTLILQTINRLAKQGLAVVMASHFPDHALLFSQKVALMKAGSFLATGSPSQIITDKNLGSLYGMEISVIKTSDPNTGEMLTLAVPRTV
jgi:iron complex transport system ATP-binding protein